MMKRAGVFMCAVVIVFGMNAGATSIPFGGFSSTYIGHWRINDDYPLSGVFKAGEALQGAALTLKVLDDWLETDNNYPGCASSGFIGTGWYPGRHHSGRETPKNVPEPGSVPLLLLGLLGIAGAVSLKRIKG
jgi:hypothetical protein